LHGAIWLPTALCDENGDLILDDQGNLQFGWVKAPIIAYFTQNVPGGLSDTNPEDR
jgi:hypothetical protein